ncbi:MAG: 4-hydroxy-tetrahydrodipicolinate reductase [Micavibrio aeruginosavorus]|uniref:4-hydroxy-tetrahydrodipicolinate reductase n=1 Tax=Micavibrio aeruginosavorus TaxID=349221 RepID=A0A2W5MXH5_9BACT|nr:MAG: 4-hydroxy-tetrahydrodipicolinate reductase [Micavibrio aeruginosavorus]
MKLGIAGYTGRVGKLLVAELKSGAWGAMELAAGSSRTIHPEHFPSETFSVFTEADDLMTSCDCVIDFTTPETTEKNIVAAVKAQTALVIGTTGLDEAEEKRIREASKIIPIIYAANMSIGVNLLLALVEQAAAKLGPAWDIEIAETHHKNKVDAPSGTALAIGKAAQKGRGGRGEFVTDRYGKRNQGDIGFAVSRGGDVVGDHTLTFYGAGEKISLGHSAADRALFARGALQAAAWLNGKPAGLYTMRDVLGL